MIRKYIAIGDIHGKLNLLQKLEAKLETEDLNATVVFLGDYVDRGPNSKEVIDFIMNKNTFQKRERIFLLGNHESMFMDYINHNLSDNTFLLNGGTATLQSYANSLNIPFGNICANIPKEHLDFLKNLKLYHETDKFFFVHAGVDPYKGRKSYPNDFIWIREKFLDVKFPIFNGKLIIHGHTPYFKKPESGKDVEFIPDVRLNLDTGACFRNGNLTAAVLTDDESFQNFKIIQAI